MVFIVPERGYEIVIGELAGVRSGGRDFGIGRDGGVFAPLSVIVGGDSIAIIGKVEVDLEDAVTELIIEEESFVGIGVGITENTTKSVGDIGVVFDPTVVEIIGWLRARNVGYGIIRDVPVSGFIVPK